MSEINQSFMNTDPPVQAKELEPSSSFVKAGVFDQVIIRINQGLAWIAGICLTLMMLTIVFNAIIRIFATPFAGTPELVGWLGALTVSFALGYTHLHRGHVDIDLLVKKFPKSLEKALSILMTCLSLVFFAIVAWRLIEYGIHLKNSKSISQTLQISYYPLIFLTSLGFFGLALALLKQLVDTVKGGT